MIDPMALIVCVLAAALLVVLFSTLQFKVDSREPPVIHPKIPLIGHIIGMMAGGATYFRKLHQASKHPIFTLPMLNGRAYIVADPVLCAAVQKASTTLSFDPIVAEMTPRLVGLNAHTKRIIQGPPGQKLDSNNIVKKSHPIINTPLLPQNVLEATQAQLHYFCGVVSRTEHGSKIDLVRFVRETVIAASMTTFYGPNNPFAKHPELMEDFWDWETGNLAYSTGIFPTIFARKAAQGLEACVKGFKEYIEKGGYDDAYKLVRDRYQLHLEEGITDSEQLARLEVALSLGFNVNAASTSLWVVDQIFSRPELLWKIREEVRANALVDHGVLSAECLRKACPQLFSVYRETLRVYVPSASARLVIEDTTIAGNWFLRKGAVIQLPGDVVHHNQEVWGPDADVFNPDRFLYSANGSKTNPDGSVPAGKEHFIHPAAFRCFGGGTSKCPGRWLGTDEILGLSALLVMGYDMEPVNGTAWNPPADVYRLPVAAMKPLAPLDVKMSVRKEFEGVKWEIRP